MALRGVYWPATMYRMARATMGLRIRRARERKGWTREQLADALPRRPDGSRVGVRSIGRWEQGEATPRNMIGALEEVLEISLAEGRQAGDFYANPSDPDEMTIWWDWRGRYDADQRKELIDKLRSVKRARERDTGT